MQQIVFTTMIYLMRRRRKQTEPQPEPQNGSGDKTETTVVTTTSAGVDIEADEVEEETYEHLMVLAGYPCGPTVTITHVCCVSPCGRFLASAGGGSQRRRLTVWSIVHKPRRADNDAPTSSAEPSELSEPRKAALLAGAHAPRSLTFFMRYKAGIEENTTDLAFISARCRVPGC